MTRAKFDYLIKLTYDPEYKGYVSDVVNLYGCMSQGKTKAEALKNTKIAVNAYMGALARKGNLRNVEFRRTTVLTPVPAL